MNIQTKNGKQFGSMMSGGTAIRTTVQLSYNLYLHYTFFDKPQLFSEIDNDSETGNEFFDNWDKINFPEKED